VEVADDVAVDVKVGVLDPDDVTDGSEDVDCVAAALLGAEDAEAVTD